MNERIKELEQQAWEKWGMKVSQGYLNEFAELIVKECITEFNKYSTVDFATVKVKEHFGVK